MNKLLGIVRKHLGPVMAGTAACLILVGGILVLTIMGTGTSHAAGSSTPTTTAPAPAKPSKPKHHATRGTVAAMSATTWTVTVHGQTITINVTPQTSFGTKAAPLTPAGFAVGDQVAILGQKTGQTIT
ncbi:MAG: DUF5666 domain-containing protein, partial [Actinomycetota bacterium]|nr:DUF5666 domain-containing protein [Actinomycetota bacterium]